jgi:LPS sulfotransferase NodH
VDDDGDRSLDDLTGRHMRKRGRIPGMSEIEREERNAEIVRDRLRGQSWEYLAEKYNLTIRQIRDIYNGWRADNQPTYQGRDPIEIVHSMLDRLNSWVEQLAEVADTASADATRIAAINAQLNALTRTAELMQATGILPHDLGTLRLELDVQTLAVKLVTVLTDQGATPEMKRAILETLRADALQQPALPA